MLWLRTGPLPVLLAPGSELAVGAATVSRSGEAVVGRDPYGVERVRLLDDGDQVVARPVHPVYRPRRLASCLVVEFEEPVLAGRSGTLWLRAPFDLEVAARGKPLMRLATARVKYALHGDLVGGSICRYYRSRVYTEPPRPGPGEALLPIRLRLSEPTLLTHVVAPIEALELYAGRNTIAYSAVELSGGGATVTSRALEGKPLPGLARVAPAIGGRRTLVTRLGWDTWWGPTGF